tara:strand:- start:2867 stop:3127 length:261 start_codon:yes stop_codon:yes gene_type:complete
LSFFDKSKYFIWNIQFERWEILALLVFRALEFECRQKPKVLKYAVGSMKHNFSDMYRFNDLGSRNFLQSQVSIKQKTTLFSQSGSK